MYPAAPRVDAECGARVLFVLFKQNQTSSTSLSLSCYSNCSCAHATHLGAAARARPSRSASRLGRAVGRASLSPSLLVLRSPEKSIQRDVRARVHLARVRHTVIIARILPPPRARAARRDAHSGSAGASVRRSF